MKHSIRPIFKAKLVVAAVAACFATVAQSNPVGPAIVNGTASFAQQGSTLTITNSNGAIINWQGFSINANETTRFIQPSASSTVLNRVVTQDPSTLLGSLQSNGRVFLINTAGIMVGQGARIDVAGFVASTLNISDQDFLANRLNFSATPNAGNLSNAGAITTPTGGSVYLVAANVENTGVINTPGGETILAAGQTVQLIDTSTPGVKVTITGDQNQATNLGAIVAESGRIGIAGVLVKNSGALNASSVVSEGGRIFLRATKDAIVDGNSQISATGAKGGQIEVLGNRVAVTDNAQLDVSGSNGGGTVLVGGDYQGKNPDVQNAQVTYFGPQASIKADATDNGNGGKVIVWADDTTRAYGSISARGGANGGDGGFVEVSGKQHLEFAAQADTSAPLGQTGTLLLDPTDITIVGGLTTPTGSFTLGAYSGVNATDSIGWTNIESQLGSNNVVIQTSSAAGGTGNITVSGSPSSASLAITHTSSWGSFTNTYSNLYSSNNKLSLLAENAVTISAPFGNAGTGAIEIIAGWDGSLASPNLIPNYTVGKNITFSGSGGIVTNGALTLKAADTIQINATTGYTGIDMNTGNLTMVANRIILDASTATSNNFSAQIATNGDQSFTVGYGGTNGQLQLMGANTTSVYGGRASIDRFDGSGGQNFTFLNGSNLTLLGGSGNGTVPAGQWTGDCVTGFCSSNSANIENNAAGGQNFAFSAGSSLTLTGGSVGNDNSASIHNRVGAQTISGNPIITLTGGASGGYAYQASGIWYQFENGAELNSDGTQTINAASITMNGGGNATTLGGAFLGSKAGQTITTTGALSMTGGASTNSTDQYGLGTSAVIGEESGASITLNIGGALSMNGGTGSASPALIGSAMGAPTISITAASVSMASGTGGAKIGVLTGGPAGSLSMTTTGNISQDASSAINTATLSALSSVGTINLAGPNLVNTVTSLSAYGNVGYVSAQSVHVGSATSTMSGTTALITTGASSNLYLGTASGATVNATSAGGIYDDNGSGVTNITATTGTTLSSTGATLGNLGISADVDAPSINATVTGSYGGISIRSTGATAPASVTLTDNAATTSQGVSYYRYGALTLNGGTTFNSTSVNIGASGPITLGAFTQGVIAGQALSISSAGDITVTGNVSSAGDLKLGAANLNMTGGNTLYAAYNLYATTAGNMRINQSTITAGGIADLTLNGSASTLYLNDVSTYASPAKINAGSEVKVHLPGRSSGGVIINGVETLTTVAAAGASGSGFYVASNPVALVPGSSVIYGVTAVSNPVQDQLASSTTSISNDPGTTANQSVLVPSTSTGSGSLTGDSTQTAGGTTGAFGAESSSGGETAASEGSKGGSSSDKKSADKDDKKDKDDKGKENGTKKDDKSKDKKNGSCT